MNLIEKTHRFVEDSLDGLFPVRMGRRLPPPDADSAMLEMHLLDMLDSNLEPSAIKNAVVASSFIAYQPQLKASLKLDVEAIYAGDPAANSHNEIVLAYPGFKAIACHRIAHFLLSKGVSLLPRLIMEYAHGQTGIDIHPGAVIGESFCIDHGTGVVIGESTVIGDRVKIYQGVTLGALSVPDRDSCAAKRHPTIGNDVIIYAQAIILGGDTVIGDGTILGGNVWITESVPAGSRIYYDNSHSITRPASQPHHSHERSDHAHR